MSWKATAYVKDIETGISAQEKLLLFVLADYHHTEQKLSWPSVPVLARKALCSERQVYRMLAELETRAMIQRVQNPGKIAAYRFTELDGVTPDHMSPLNTMSPLTSPLTKTALTPDKNEGAIRKERVNGTERGEAAPDIHPLQLAKGFLEKIGLPLSEGNLKACCFAIETVMSSQGYDSGQACDWLLVRAQEAVSSQEKVNKWWFEDGMQRYLGVGNGQNRKLNQRLAAVADGRKTLLSDLYGDSDSADAGRGNTEARSANLAGRVKAMGAGS